jgi:hypothetical protein
MVVGAFATGPGNVLGGFHHAPAMRAMAEKNPKGIDATIMRLKNNMTIQKSRILVQSAGVDRRQAVLTAGPRSRSSP